jgi:hypothetical protein
MARKAKTDLATKSAIGPAANAGIHVDARIAVGMFFTLTGTILAAFGFSTRDRVDAYIKTLGIDANLWWGLVLLVFGIVMLAFGRRGQMKMEKDSAAAPTKR